MPCLIHVSWRGLDTHLQSYSAYISFMSTWTTWLVSFGGLILMTLAPYSFGRKILLDYAETLTFGGFSHAGPTTEQLADMSFTMRMYATGSSVPPAADGTGAPVEDVTKVIEVAGPEPGYVATPRFVVNAAYVLLKAGRSGVMTPAVRQLRRRVTPCYTVLHRFTPFRTSFSALHHRSHAVWCDLLRAHAYQMLSGACNPMLYPIHVSRSRSAAPTISRGSRGSASRSPSCPR